MWKTVIWVALIAFISKIVYNAVDYLDLLKHDVIARHAPGPCLHLSNAAGGSEDLTTLEDGRTFISSGIFEDREAKILYFDFLDPTHKIQELKMESDIGLKAVSFHGLTAYQDPKTREVTLMVINHAKDGDHVEVFKYNDKQGKLVHIKSITDPLFKHLNDLVALDSTKFYTTSMFKWSPQEALFYIKTGSILYYNGSSARTVSSGHMLANGINKSPDQKYIYLAEVGMKKLVAFKRKQNNDLELSKELFLDSSIDNIEVDPKSGDLWIGSHPRAHQIIAYDKIQGKMYAPSQVFKVKCQGDEFKQILEVYLDDGREISASTVAYGYKGRLIIGSLGAPPLLCDLTYVG